MLRAVSHAHTRSVEPYGTVVLDSADRHLRRKLIRTDQGEELMVDLAEAVLLSDGDMLVLYDGTVDGKIGQGSRDAIKAFQARSGLATDGHPSK